MLNIKGFFKNILVDKPSLKEAVVRRSYSQCGEDLIIDYLFRLKKVETPTYIDIGANDPYYLSNTAFFYEKGLKGVCVDPDPHFKNLFSQYRHRDLFVQAGVAGCKDTLPFYIMSDNTLNTFSVDELTILKNAGHTIIKELSIPVYTLHDVISTHCNGIFPDLLSLDVEGLDKDILFSYDFTKNGPKVICVEMTEYSPKGTGKKRIDIYNYLCDAGYIEYASTYLNGIFVKEDFWLA